MSDTEKPEPAAGDKKNPMHYDIDAIRAAIRSGQIPKEALTEVLGPGQEERK
jgi:hypothetical protein